MRVAGRIWFEEGDRSVAGGGRIELLRRIGQHGSIARAAKSMGMGYKAAWDAVDAMNNLSPRPLVERKAGGRRGGGTLLTADGEALIRVYDAAQVEYRRFLQRLSLGIERFDEFHELVESMSMKTSARNLLRGTVTLVTEGAVNAEVVLDLAGTPLVAIVTNESVRALGLAEGVEAFALIKASWVILATGDGGLRTSARNRLCGTVERCTEGAVNAEVVLALAGGMRLTAIITMESLRELGLAPGQPACALIKAPHVILAVNE